MENYNLDDELFGSLDNTLSYLDENTGNSVDGLYRIDLNKAKDKKIGYRAVVRFLPNVTREGKLGDFALTKISHFVRVPDAKELVGWYDSPRNFKKPCALTNTYYALTDDKKGPVNAILKERAEKTLSYSKKYYSYVLVLEDEQCPEYVGKIMVMEYKATINDKIKDELNGVVTGETCKVFHTTKGKDFRIIVKEKTTEDGRKFPDYNSCIFKEDTSSIPIFKDGVMKRLPVGDDGDVRPEHRAMLRDYLLSRTVELESFAPQPLTEEQEGKVTEIVNYLTGKTSFGGRQNSEAVASRSDLDLETESAGSPVNTDQIQEQSADDFFNSF